MSEWLLTVVLWLGGPAVVSGPYTEAECMAEGEAWYTRALQYAARNPQLYTGRRGLHWSCFPNYPDLPEREVTFPTLQKRNPP